MKIVIYGAGGHGREVADVLQDRIAHGHGLELVGFADDDPTLHGRTAGAVPIVGDLSSLNPADASIIIAVGNPQTAQRLAERARASGFTFASAISPRAYVSSRTTIGQGVAIFPNVVVQPGARIGDHALLNVAATVSHDSIVGAHANINPGAHLAGNVSVGEGAFIGMGANVIQGRTVGDWARVGAGAVVLDDIPAHSTAVGIPARVVRRGEIQRRT